IDAALVAFRRDARKGALQSLGWGTAAILLHAPYVIYMGGDLTVLTRSILWIMGIVAAGSGAWALRNARTLTVEDLEHHLRAVEFSKAVSKTKASFTLTMVLLLWFIAFAQTYFDEARSIQAAGL